MKPVEKEWLCGGAAKLRPGDDVRKLGRTSFDKNRGSANGIWLVATKSNDGVGNESAAVRELRFSCYNFFQKQLSVV